MPLAGPIADMLAPDELGHVEAAGAYWRVAPQLLELPMLVHRKRKACGAGM
jgi:hypothetical protein